MQSIDFKWFVANLPSLFEQYGTKFLAIKDQHVLGAYSSYAVAVKETQKTEQLGSFIVQRCGADDSVYTNYISSFSFISASEV